MLQALIMITVNGVAEPFVDKIESRMHLFNEFFVVILCYHLFPLTEFMTDLEVRNNYVGKSLIATTLFNLGVNILLTIT